MDDLVERLKNWRLWALQEKHFRLREDINHAIAALSPVLPEEIDNIVGMQYPELRDLIERLARDCENWRKLAPLHRQQTKVVKQQRQRIEELETYINKMHESLSTTD